MAKIDPTKVFLIFALSTFRERKGRKGNERKRNETEGQERKCTKCHKIV